jgi:hypothetical protein
LARPGLAIGPAGLRGGPRGLAGRGGEREVRDGHGPSCGVRGGPTSQGLGARGRGFTWRGATVSGGGGVAHAGFAEDGGAAGPRVASWLSVGCAHERGNGGRRLTEVSPTRSEAELAPTWRLRGCHVGRLEEDEGRPAGTDGGRRRRSLELVGTSSAKGRRTGVMIRTRGIKPSARMHRKWLDGEESRRRTPATAKEGKGDGTTRDRFLRARASTRPRDCIPSTGLGGATPREAGDERRLAAASGNGGDATPGGGKGLGGARELLGVLRVLPRNLRGGGGAKRENGGELYRDRTGRCDERPTAR